MTEDKYASVLYPLVESCLPQDILRIWERQREKTSKGKTELHYILEFLRSEVISEERISLARTSFNLDKSKKQSNTKFNFDDYKVATVNELIVGDKLLQFKDKPYYKKIDDILCIFCDKTHASDKCFKASSLSYDEKKELNFKKGSLFYLSEEKSRLTEL